MLRQPPAWSSLRRSTRRMLPSPTSSSSSFFFLTHGRSAPVRCLSTHNFTELPRPHNQSPSYFTGRPHYFDSLHTLNAFLRPIRQHLLSTTFHKTDGDSIIHETASDSTTATLSNRVHGDSSTATLSNSDHNTDSHHGEGNKEGCILTALNQVETDIDEAFHGEVDRENGKWMMRRALVEMWEAKVSDDEYKRFIRGLMQLERWLAMLDSSSPSRLTPPSIRGHGTLLSPSMLDRMERFLEKYRRVGVTMDGEGSIGCMEGAQVGRDALGRFYAVGKRRRVRAHVWIVEAKPDEVTKEVVGEVWINGRPMSDVLERMRSRFRIYLPFGVTDTVGLFNIWVETEASHDQNIGETGLSFQVFMSL
jgi:hypothetical protein